MPSFFWLVNNVMFSLLLIAVIHYLIGFFKSTLTVPKVKDLVTKPSEQYEEILNTINSNSDKSEMKSELAHFLKEQMRHN